MRPSRPVKKTFQSPLFKTAAPPAPNLDQVAATLQQLFAQGRYQEAVDLGLRHEAWAKASAGYWSDMSACYVKLCQWQDAIRTAQRALAIDASLINPYDALAHAYFVLADYEKVKRYGCHALSLRDKTLEPIILKPYQAFDIPTRLNADRSRNVIAFSLFGSRSKYCETAVCNIAAQQEFFPNWTCRFYVDDTVPAHVVMRLQDGGEVVHVDAALKAWPGPMWRFAAYDDAHVERIIFRDTDSVLSLREAVAVAEWVASGKAFHIMRDSGSHTELILAGMWGGVKGAIGSMRDLVNHYLIKPVKSEHFADQYFLRQYIWPLAKQSMLQHDSLFGFLETVPFTQAPHRANFRVGDADGGVIFGVPTPYKQGTSIMWRLRNADEKQAFCAYAAVVGADGMLHDNLPPMMIERLQKGTYCIEFEPIDVST